MSHQYCHGGVSLVLIRIAVTEWRVMKLLNIDWVEMLEFLYLWEDLGRDDKDYFLFSMEPGAVAADSIPVDTADSLESCGLVSISASGNKLSFTNPARQYQQHPYRKNR